LFYLNIYCLDSISSIATAGKSGIIVVETQQN